MVEGFSYEGSPVSPRERAYLIEAAKIVLDHPDTLLSTIDHSVRSNESNQSFIAASIPVEVDGEISYRDFWVNPSNKADMSFLENVRRTLGSYKGRILTRDEIEEGKRFLYSIVAKH